MRWDELTPIITEVHTRPPLSTLLSQVLMAFTIEFDNEFECLAAHRTTRKSAKPARPGPWLVSLVMWSNLMRFLDGEERRVSELRDTGGNLKGMERWGYVVIEPAPADTRTKPSRADHIVRPTRAGRASQEVWRPLFGTVEGRWERRLGERPTRRLRASLQALVGRFDLVLPEYLPVVTANLRAYLPRVPSAPAPHLSALLSQVLLAFTLEFEQEAPVSLAISANLLRVLDERGVRVRDLPGLTGVSKEAISWSASVLERGQDVVIEPDRTTSRAGPKIARLTPKGRAAQETYHRALGVIEARWQQRYGEEAIHAVRESLEALAGGPDAPRSPLLAGLGAHPDGWRASVRPLEVLAHQPMVLHRGGYPDGS